MMLIGMKAFAGQKWLIQFSNYFLLRFLPTPLLIRPFSIYVVVDGQQQRPNSCSGSTLFMFFLFRLLPSTSSPPVPPALWDVFPAYSWGWKVINFISFSISVPLIYLWTRRSLSLALVQHSFIIIIINIIIYPSMRRNGGERTGCDDPSKMTECEAIKSWHVVLLSPHSPLTAQCSSSAWSVQRQVTIDRITIHYESPPLTRNSTGSVPGSNCS